MFFGGKKGWMTINQLLAGIAAASVGDYRFPELENRWKMAKWGRKTAIKVEFTPVTSKISTKRTL